MAGWVSGGAALGRRMAIRQLQMGKWVVAMLLLQAAPALCFHAAHPLRARSTRSTAHSQLTASRMLLAAAAPSGGKTGSEPMLQDRLGTEIGEHGVGSPAQMGGVRSAHSRGKALLKGILRWVSRAIVGMLAVIGIGLGAWAPAASAAPPEAGIATVGVIRTDGWQKDRDPRTGRTFYINHQVRGV